MTKEERDSLAAEKKRRKEIERARVKEEAEKLALEKKARRREEKKKVRREEEKRSYVYRRRGCFIFRSSNKIVANNRIKNGKEKSALLRLILSILINAMVIFIIWAKGARHKEQK